MFAATHHEYIEVDSTSFTSPQALDATGVIARMVNTTVRESYPGMQPRLSFFRDYHPASAFSTQHTMSLSTHPFSVLAFAIYTDSLLSVQLFMQLDPHVYHTHNH